MNYFLIAADVQTLCSGRCVLAEKRNFGNVPRGIELDEPITVLSCLHLSDLIQNMNHALLNAGVYFELFSWK